jgi:hypothetical protein
LHIKEDVEKSSTVTFQYCFLDIEVLRIRDVYPGSRVEKIPYPHKRIQVFLSSVLKNKIRDVHPGSRILDLDFFPSQIPYPDPETKKAPNPGSATLH